MKEMKALVSVVIPSYNHARFVKEAIQSVINQDYKEIELLVIDDGSIDDSVEIINAMVPLCEERFVRFEFRNRSNRGISATLNEAIEWCKGDYFSPLASDDVALPHKISFLLKKHQELDAAAVFGSSRKFGASIVSKNVILNCEHNHKELLFLKNIPSAPASLIKTAALRKVGGYLDDLALEDFYMWLKLTSIDEKLYSFPEIVVKYRDHEKNTVKNFMYMNEQRLKVLSFFSNSTHYEKARINAVVLGAKAIANEKTMQPIRSVFKEKIYNLDGLLIVIKSLTPKFIIKSLKNKR